MGAVTRRNKEGNICRWQSRALSIATSAWLILTLAGTASAQVTAPRVPDVPIPPTVDPFSLSFEDFKKYSAAQGFELLGQSYFKVPERTDWAKGLGRPGPEIGSGFNTVRVYDGIAYMAGYNSPSTIFGVLIADVRNPRDMKPLSFIPCNPGTRCGYLRVSRKNKILTFSHDTGGGNPTKQPAGQTAKAGVSVYDVADPRNPKELAFVPLAPDGQAHGLDADDLYVYACGQFSPNLNREALSIIDFGDRSNIRQVGTWHVPGMMKGEQLGPMNRNGPDGKPQIIQCHEILHYNNRIYAAWRDAGMVILDVTDRTAPKLLATFDYIPPFHGGGLGAAHTSLPVVTRQGEHPDLVVHTDEIFDCPTGFGRILDVSDVRNPEVVKGERPANVVLLSTFRFDYVSDNVDRASGEFVCDKDGPNGRSGTTTHLPVIDQRSPSLVYVTWYDEGLRVMDISNPFAPVFTGYFLSPRTGAPNGRRDGCGTEEADTRRGGDRVGATAAFPAAAPAADVRHA